MDTLKNDKIRWIAVVGVLMAMNIALCTFSIPVPGGHLYLNDVVICTASILLDPFGAFLVGGVGAFLGDLFFYPAPMFVSLATHGLQAIVISLCVRKLPHEHKVHAAIVGTLFGAVIMVLGYTLGKIYVYSTLEYAILKLPFEIAQALLGVVVSIPLCFRAGLLGTFRKLSQTE